MFKKTIIVSVFLALVVNNIGFSQAVSIDTALLNATDEILESIPGGTRIAVLNITSDFETLSNYVIDELIVNFVRTRAFQVVPRSAVEFELANSELDFQMTGFVSDESQQSLGRFLGAETIITGGITRDAANVYRLIINSIHVESFTFQSSFRASIVNDRQMRALIAAGGGVFHDDYTTGERLGMGFFNILGGAGSISNGHRSGWVVTAAQAVGIVSVIYGAVRRANAGSEPNPIDYTNPSGFFDREIFNTEMEIYKENINISETVSTIGTVFICGGIVFGLIVPFFHEKHRNTSVVHSNFPFNLELVSSNNRDINGFKMTYIMRF